MRRLQPLVLLLVLAIAVASCTDATDDDADRSDPPASDDGAAPDGDDGAEPSEDDGEDHPADIDEADDTVDEVEPLDRTGIEVIGSAPYQGDEVLGIAADDLTIEVTGVERTSDGYLAVNWQLRNTADEPLGLGPLFGRIASQVDGVYVADGSRQAPPLTDEDEECLCVYLFEKDEVVEAGHAKRYRSVHPDLGTDTVAFRANGFDEVTDLPVTEASLADPATDGVAVVAAAAQEGVTVEIEPLERHDDVAILRATIDNASAEEAHLSMAGYAMEMTVTMAAPGSGAVTLVAGDHHLRVLTDASGACYCSASGLVLAGERRELAWVFSAPGDQVADVTVNMPWFGTIPGVPVVDAEGPLELELDGSPVEELAPSRDRRARLIASIEELEDDLVTRVTDAGGDTTDVAMAADVLFDFDSADLRAEADPLIDDLVEQLEAAGQLTDPVVVEGHTDPIGDPSYNLELSELRAASVLAAIEDRLDRGDVVFETVGHGAQEPVADNGTEEGRQRNRRVTVRVPTDR